MLLKLTFVALALCALTSGTQLQSAQQHLAKILLKSNAAFKNNPTRSLACFAEYLDELNAVTESYETAFAACKTVADDSLSVLEQSVAADRESLQSLADSTCQLFTDCNAIESSLDFFSCYQSAGNEASRTTHSIGTKAAQQAKDIEQKQSEINYVKDRCQAESKTQYEIDADNAFISLQNCLSAPEEATTTIEPTTEVRAILPSEVVKQALKNIKN